jgi:outer membrane protein
MTRTSHAALLAGLLFFLPTLALGEDLLQIYDLAVENDPTLKEAGAQLNATREVKPQAKALLLPNIGLGRGHIQQPADPGQ